MDKPRTHASNWGVDIAQFYRHFDAALSHDIAKRTKGATARYTITKSMDIVKAYNTLYYMHLRALSRDELLDALLTVAKDKDKEDDQHKQIAATFADFLRASASAAAKAAIANDTLLDTDLDNWNKVLSNALYHSSTKAADDEEYSELENKLMNLVSTAYDAGNWRSLFSELLQMVLASTPSRPMHQVMAAGRALVAIGKMQHLQTAAERRVLLEVSLLCSVTNAYIRSSAILGLSYLNDPRSLDTLREAELQESDRIVKKQILRIREQLEETKAEQS